MCYLWLEGVLPGAITTTRVYFAVVIGAVKGLMPAAGATIHLLRVIPGGRHELCSPCERIEFYSLRSQDRKNLLSQVVISEGVLVKIGIV